MKWCGIAPLFILLITGCVAPLQSDPSQTTPHIRAPAAETTQSVRPEPQPVAHPQPARAAAFSFDGALEQGGWIRGTVPGGAISAYLDDAEIRFDEQGRFFAAFDRDAGPHAVLSAKLADGRSIETSLAIAPRGWDIEHINAARRPGGASEAFMARRRPELSAIWEARQTETGSEGWRQDFIWPAIGRISGRFGSQRIYRGEPGSYHSGLDIAGGDGTIYVAPADGVVVLARQGFSLEGNLIIIDHGQGLNSAFLHASELFVKEGQAVKQGQKLGRIGATGRATGPHLHWSLKWRDARLDPLLFLPPMP